ncbi:pectate lyase [Sphingobacterium sp. DN00404]|uniref:Pectate lyase n=1 Tax=Sphingobacterium micropteri TaxID=2763501 RepID=A0ABR7YPJ2_9SPHI|nr:pectate lyase [Sphingobacterium micropteri]MBD1433254.1 pectate lyase [Sphingobacterium micropteri]
MIRNYFCILVTLLASAIVTGQDRHNPTTQNYLRMRWTTVATGMPSAWYNTDEAKRVAENVLVSQKDIGGWVKNQPYHHVFSDSLRTYYKSTKNDVGGTFDNGSTISELRFLAKVYTHFKDERYKEAFNKGLNYIFSAQYDNGGWPQFYPIRDAGEEIRTDRTVPYSMHITYNDNAMVNIMNFLKDIYADVPEFVPLKIAPNTKDKARKAFDKGVECMLKTQISVNSKPTVWCAQHHYKTLAPVKARSYELESFSGSESVGIVALLMDIDHPSPAVIAAIDGACTWFEQNKIEGIRVERQMDSHGNRNTVVVADREAPPIWARFYDLETAKPYFCDRDGIKKYALDEIGAERRNGYSWYTNAPQRVLDAQSEWQKKLPE